MSWTRFMKAEFEHGLEITKGNMQTVDYYWSLADEECLKIEYADILNTPMKVASTMDQRLGLRLKNNQVASSVVRLRKEKISKRLKLLEVNLKQRIKCGEPSSANELVPNADGTFRVYDTRSGFQSGHISGYREGDWKKILTDQLQSIIERELGPWLLKNGYR